MNSKELDTRTQSVPGLGEDILHLLCEYMPIWAIKVKLKQVRSMMSETWKYFRKDLLKYTLKVININPKFLHPFKYFITISMHKMINWRNNSEEITFKLEKFHVIVELCQQTNKKAIYAYFTDRSPNNIISHQCK